MVLLVALSVLFSAPSSADAGLSSQDVEELTKIISELKSLENEQAKIIESSTKRNEELEKLSKTQQKRIDELTSLSESRLKIINEQKKTIDELKTLSKEQKKSSPMLTIINSIVAVVLSFFGGFFVGKVCF
jgi:leucyl-tRNA synthetase